MSNSLELERVTKNFSLTENHSLKDLILGTYRKTRKESRFPGIHDLTFSVATGESIALLGNNGCGKSTTLKLIAGVLRPDSGVIRARGRVAPLLELGTGFHPDLSGRENIFLNAAILGLTRRETLREFETIVEFSGVGKFLDTPVKFYSSGMLVRLGFAVAVHSEPEILLIDEVLSVGDAEFQAKSKERIKSFRREGVSIILVTHDWGLASEFCDRGLLLRAGALVAEADMETLLKDRLEHDSL